MGATVSSIPIVKQAQQLIKASARPVPGRYGDGRYDADVDPKPTRGSIRQDIESQLERIPQDLDLMINTAIMNIKDAGYEDDRKYLVEKLIQLIVSLPNDSRYIPQITDSLLNNLWNVLHHPPLSYLGCDYPIIPRADKSLSYPSHYRAPDGSGNNIMYPHLGMAGTPYAKSVQPLHPQHAVLPDSGVLFDALLARKEYKEHPNKISSLLFYLASIIIHDLFNTSHTDPSVSETSSYLDLAPLYGSNEDQQKTVRTFADGKLKADCFYDARILGFPPGVGVLLVCFNRYHNYIVDEMAQINEHGRFSQPNLDAIKVNVRAVNPKWTDTQINQAAQKKYDTDVTKRDENLFQTARLVTCGLYVNCILYDYIRTIISLNRTNDPWILDPRAAGPHVYSSQGTPMGVGNQVSCEFNLIYHWHAAVSDRDDKWTQMFTAKVFPGQDMSKISLEDFKLGLSAWGKSIDPNPWTRTWGGLVRNKTTGGFDDASLIKIITESTEDCAAAFDSGIPVVLRAVEMLGIEQSRNWRTASLNEFRKFFGLLQHKSFEAVHPDPEVVKVLRQMYDHPDNIELYPGLIIEDVKKPMAPGSGLCPPQTIGKAILSDAVALVRGDRFYTVDYSPANLTQFGFNAVATDPTVAQGGVMYRLLMRAFPGWYEYNSVYALYPFTIPKENEKILTTLKTVSSYSFKQPTAPSIPIPFSTAENAKKILGNQNVFKVVWGKAISSLTGNYEFMLSADKPENTADHKEVLKALYTDAPKGMDEVWDFYIKRTNDLLKERSYPLGEGFQVDAVRDVINMVHVQFVSQLFTMPLKDPQSKLEPITEKQMWDILAILFGYVFLDRDEVSSFALHEAVDTYYKMLAQLVRFNVATVSHGGKVKSWLDGIEKDGFLDSYGNNFIRRMLKAGRTIDQITKDIMPTAAASTANQGQQSIQMLDVYMQDDYKHHWPEIVKLAKCDDKESRLKLRKYAMEGCRLSTQSFGLFRSVAQDISIDEGGTTHNLKAGEQVFVNLVAANVDPVAFPDPLKVKLDRDPSCYVNYGWGPHKCIGQEINIVANTAILRCFALLPGLKRTPGLQGQLKYVKKQGVVKVYLQEDWGSYFFFPTTMKVQFEELPK